MPKRKVIRYSLNLVPDGWTLEDVTSYYEKHKIIFYQEDKNASGICTNKPEIIEHNWEVTEEENYNQVECVKFIDINTEEGKETFKFIENGK